MIKIKEFFRPLQRIIGRKVQPEVSILDTEASIPRRPMLEAFKSEMRIFFNKPRTKEEAEQAKIREDNIRSSFREGGNHYGRIWG